MYRRLLGAGGSVVSDADLLERMELASEVGAIGGSVGRNILQHSRPKAMTRTQVRVLRDGWSAQRSLEEPRDARVTQDGEGSGVVVCD